MRSSWNPFNRLWNLTRDAGLPASLYSATTSGDPKHLAFLRSMRKDFQLQASTELPLADLEVVVVDIETTGFQPYHGDEIIAIGAVAMRGSQVLNAETFYSYINPKRVIPEQIVTLTGITNDCVKEAPDLLSTLSQFFQFVGSRPLVAHHSRHEREFFRASLWKTSRSKFTHRLLDTMLLIRLSAAPLGNGSLDALCAAHQIDIKNRHDAFFDALAAANLWGIYLNKAISLGYGTLHQVYEQVGVSE